MSIFDDLGQQQQIPVIIKSLPPHNADETGILEYDPEDGIRLTLIDTHSTITSMFGQGPQVIPMLHAQLGTEHVATLLNAFDEKMQLGLHGHVERRIVVNQMLLDVLLDEPEEKCFGEVRLNFTELNGWMGFSPFKPNYDDPDRTIIELLRIPQLGVSLPLPGNSLLSLQARSTEFCGVNTSAELRSNVCLSLSRRAAFSLSEAHEQAYVIQSFISMLYGRQAFIKRMKLDLMGQDGVANAITVVTRFPRSPFPERTTSVPRPMLIWYPLIGFEFGEIWARWNAKFHLYKAAVALHMGTELFHGQMTQFEFLAAVQALETLHRHLHQGSYLEKDEYGQVEAKLCAAIPSFTPADLRSALKSRIKYGNEYSLRKRLYALWDTLPKTIREALHPDLTAFTEAVIDTRNYLTHFMPNGHMPIKDGGHLHFAAQLLRWCFRAVLLADLGVSEALMEKAFSDSSELGQTRSRLLAHG